MPLDGPVQLEIADLGALRGKRRCEHGQADGSQNDLLHNTRIVLLGNAAGARLPFFSFRLRTATGSFFHHQLVTRMLSDCHGIQARGGCACAGPYAHRLLNIDKEASAQKRRAILSGHDIEKPGFVRLSLSYLLTDAEAIGILDAVTDLAQRAETLAPLYEVDPATAIFRPRKEVLLGLAAEFV